MSIVQEAIQAWRRNAVALNPGASPGELEALRDLPGVTFSDFLELYVTNPDALCIL